MRKKQLLKNGVNSVHVIEPDPQRVKQKNGKQTKVESLGILFYLKLYKKYDKFEGNLGKCSVLRTRRSECEKAIE